jgi:hypothetical protein
VTPAPGTVGAPPRYWSLAQAVTAEADRRLKRAVMIGTLTPLLVAFAWGASVLPLPGDLGPVGQVVLFLVTAGISLGLLLLHGTGGDYRRALVVGGFARETSFRRWREATDEPAPPLNPSDAAAWLRRHPDEATLPEQRLHALINVGDLARAREALPRYPLDTGRRRFAHAADAWFLDFLEGRESPFAPMEAAAAEVEDPADRAMARAVIASSHAYRATAFGGDWILPMAAAYDVVAPHATAVEGWRLRYVVTTWTMTMAMISVVAGAYLLVVRWLPKW